LIEHVGTDDPVGTLAAQKIFKGIDEEVAKGQDQKIRPGNRYYRQEKEDQDQQVNGDVEKQSWQVLFSQDHAVRLQRVVSQKVS
jgi:hypothetical protein